MAQASRRARESFRYFWREVSWDYQRIVPALGLAAVKVAFTEGPVVEHMWLDQIRFDGKELVGVLLNSPNNLRSFAEGDRLRFGLVRLSDWMFTLEGRAYGGFTVNLMRSRMGMLERRAHDAAWGCDFGRPDSVELVPAWGDPESRPGLLGRVFGRRAATPDLDADHPMSLHAATSLREAIAENPSLVRARDEEGWTLLHGEALRGSVPTIGVLLEHGALRDAVTAHGMTPLDLARTLGWHRAARLLA